MKNEKQVETTIKNYFGLNTEEMTEEVIGEIVGSILSKTAELAAFALTHDKTTKTVILSLIKLDSEIKKSTTKTKTKQNLEKRIKGIKAVLEALSQENPMSKDIDGQN